MGTADGGAHRRIQCRAWPSSSWMCRGAPVFPRTRDGRAPRLRPLFDPWTSAGRWSTCPLGPNMLSTRRMPRTWGSGPIFPHSRASRSAISTAAVKALSWRRGRSTSIMSCSARPAPPSAARSRRVWWCPRGRGLPRLMRYHPNGRRAGLGAGGPHYRTRRVILQHLSVTRLYLLLLVERVYHICQFANLARSRSRPDRALTGEPPHQRLVTPGMRSSSG